MTTPASARTAPARGRRGPRPPVAARPRRARDAPRPRGPRGGGPFGRRLPRPLPAFPARPEPARGVLAVRHARPASRAAAAITVVNARTHNLKNVTCAFPVGALTVVTGPSGSGKSSLAFDTLYAEGQRRFVESMSTYARQYLERLERPDVDLIEHVLPALAIEQKAPARSARSTVGTATEIHDVLRLLFAAAGTLRCPEDGTPVRRHTAESVRAELLAAWGEGARVLVIAPRAVKFVRGGDRRVEAAGLLPLCLTPRETFWKFLRMEESRGRCVAEGSRFPLLIGRHVLRAVDPEILSSLSMAFDSGRRRASRPATRRGSFLRPPLLSRPRVRRVRAALHGSRSRPLLFQLAAGRVRDVPGLRACDGHRPGPRHPGREEVAPRAAGRAVQLARVRERL